MARHKDPVKTQIRAAKKAIRAAEKALAGLAALVRSTASRSTGAPRKITITPRRRAQLEEHGRYIGLLRNLPPRQKTRVKAMRKSKNVRAAIALAKRLARK